MLTKEYLIMRVVNKNFISYYATPTRDQDTSNIWLDFLLGLAALALLAVIFLK